MFTIRWMSLTALTLSWLLPNVAQAQPLRQLPGTRPFLVGMIPQQGAPLNPRVRPAASSVGVESTDFYGKRGYPKQLGDFYESASGVSGSASSTGSVASTGGNNGVQGVQAAGSSGFQGNTGNQIGQNGGGTVLGGLFGGGGGAGVGFGKTAGITGGGFTGIVPKGFGFGGTP